MSSNARAELARALRRLAEEPALRLTRTSDDAYAIGGAAGARIPERLVGPLVSSGLLREAEPGRLAASPAAGAWLKRQLHPDLPFRAQHHALGITSVPGESGASVLANLEESPVAALARRAGKSGEPWLKAHAVAAAERLRRDFEMGQLQPRVTANWSASVATGRRGGGGAGLADLTDMALAARLRFDRAMGAVGPDFSGLLADICCFLKGLETVERERQWPARSAKLVLRLALESLARHYGLAPAATGAAAGRSVHHWGAEDYRPKIS